METQDMETPGKNRRRHRGRAAASAEPRHWRWSRPGSPRCWPAAAARCSRKPRRWPSCPGGRQAASRRAGDAAHLGRADRRLRPGGDRGFVRHGQADLRPHRPAVQQRRDQHPRHPVRGADLRAVGQCRRGQFDRLVSVRAARLSHDEGAGPAGRADHQQRLGVGACAAPQLDALCRDQARADRAHPLAVARRARIRHRLRPDRHRQRRDDAATRTPRAAACRRPGGSRPRRASMSSMSPAASSTWRHCRSKPTSSS